MHSLKMGQSNTSNILSATDYTQGTCLIPPNTSPHHTVSNTQIPSHRQTDSQTNRFTYRHTDRHHITSHHITEKMHTLHLIKSDIISRHTFRHAARYAHRQTDTQTDKQIDRHHKRRVHTSKFTANKSISILCRPMQHNSVRSAPLIKLFLPMTYGG